MPLSVLSRAVATQRHEPENASAALMDVRRRSGESRGILGSNHGKQCLHLLDF